MASAHRGETPRQLRGYQQTAYDRLTGWMEEQKQAGLIGQSAYVGFATGMGKTTLGCTWLRDHLGELGGAVWLTHRDNLVEQVQTELRTAMGPDSVVGCEQAGKHNTESLVVASIPSLRGPRLTEFRDDMVARANGKPMLIVFDEAHHHDAASWNAIKEAFAPSSQFLNLTATPFLGTVGNMLTLGDCLCFYSTADAIDLGVLTPFAQQSLHLDELKDAQWSVQTGELTEKSTREILCDPGVIDRLVTQTLPQMTGHISLVFAASVDMALLLESAYAAKGLRSRTVTHQHTSAKDRKEILAEMRQGKIEVLCNFDVFTEGTDLPMIDHVINLRPTKFAHKYQQMTGRGLRQLNGDDGMPALVEGTKLKPECTVIDLWPKAETSDHHFSYLPLPSSLRHEREASTRLKVALKGEQVSAPWTRVDTFLASFYPTAELDRYYAAGTPPCAINLCAAEAIFGKPTALNADQKQDENYWGYHLSQDLGVQGIEAVAAHLQNSGYEYFPAGLPLRGTETIARNDRRAEVTTAAANAALKLSNMADELDALPGQARRLVTVGHTFAHRVIPRSEQPAIQTLQVNKTTELVLNPADRQMLYFRTNGEWYRLHQTQGTVPRHVNVADMELSSCSFARPRPAKFTNQDAGITPRVMGQLPCDGPAWAAASLLMDRSMNNLLSAGVEKIRSGLLKEMAL